MYANNRRSAVSKVTKFNTKEESPKHGHEIREAMMSRLTDNEKKLLELFKTNDGRTEKDVSTVFRCVAEPGRFAVETDTPPTLVAEEIIGLDKMVATQEFALPVIAVADPGWRATFAKFDPWLFSRTRYPLLAEDKKTVQPMHNTRIFTQVNEIDTIETYFAAIIGTVMQFYRTGSRKYAEMTWKLIHTAIYYMGSSIKEIDISVLIKKKQQLADHIRTRDESLQAASAYKAFLDTCRPAEYYWMLYNLMVESPESVHRSCLTKMEFVLFGLMTQTLLGEQLGCTVQGIEEVMLRMMLERTMKKTPKIGKQLDDYVAREELVAFIHKQAGTNVQNSLRYWSFLKETVKLVLDRQYSMGDFVSRLEMVKTEIYKLKGVTAFCLTLAPACEKYLTDEVLAEFILRAGKADKKFTTLQTSILVANSRATGLDEIIARNVERTQNLHKSAADEKKQLVDAKSDLKNEEAPIEVADTTFADFLVTCNIAGHPNLICSNGNWSRYRQLLVRLALQGGKDAVRRLQSTIDEAQKGTPTPLCPRRSFNLIIRVAHADSEVLKHFSTQVSQPTQVRATAGHVTGHLGTLIKDARRDISLMPPPAPRPPKRSLSVASVDAQFDEDDLQARADLENQIAAPIEFLKFELARQLVSEVQAVLQSRRSSLLECPICYDQAQQLQALHGDRRHGVCNSCKSKLDLCPFCREQLIPA